MPALAAGQQFWTSGGPLRIERVRGDAAAAQAAMRAFCRDRSPPLRGGPPATKSRATGPGEAQFVNSLAGQTPLESAGELDLYQPPGQTAMVVAVQRGSRRIVAWSLAAQRSENEWSLFHFRPAAGPREGTP